MSSPKRPSAYTWSLGRPRTVALVLTLSLVSQSFVLASVATADSLVVSDWACLIQADLTRQSWVSHGEPCPSVLEKKRHAIARHSAGMSDMEAGTMEAITDAPPTMKPAQSANLHTVFVMITSLLPLESLSSVLPLEPLTEMRTDGVLLLFAMFFLVGILLGICTKCCIFPFVGVSTSVGASRGEQELMNINGETKAQMEHVHAIKNAGGVSLNASDGSDTSMDQNWPIDHSYSAHAADTFVFITTIFWLGIKITILAIPMLACNAIPMLIPHYYSFRMPEETSKVFRGYKFYALFSITLLLSIPAVILILISLILDYTVYYLFSVSYCLCTWRWSSALASFDKIRPYRNGPSILLRLPDFFVCCIGQCARQAICETTYMVSVMWLLMPWLKYYVNCNPWIYDLDHRLCQQISTEMQDLGTPSEVADTARVLISCTRQQYRLAERIDIWNFVPHYPYPPWYRRWALGMQAGGTDYPGKFTLIVHTTHAISDVDGVKEQFVLSNSCELPIYRVMLWYSNPFHFLTGWVEASVSTGLPSQPNKKHGGEHPMWLVTGRSPQVAGRESWTGSGMIDAFFDHWLPIFVHEMRRLSFSTRFKDQVDGDKRALAIADAKYQEVHSEDGISRPYSFVGRVKYSHQDALSAIEDIAERQGKNRSHAIERRLANALSETAKPGT